MMIEELDS